MFLKKKAALLISIVLLTVILILSVTAITYAVWTTIATANEELEVPVNEYNPSEKYIIWRGIAGNGSFTDTEASIVSYAVVGYDGPPGELIIPPTHYNATQDTDLNVTKICVDNSTAANYSKRITGSPNISSIKIPATVTEIGAGAFKDMPLLTAVTILGDTALTIGDLAFANCPNLATFSVTRPITGDSGSYLMGSGYLVPPAD